MTYDWLKNIDSPKVIAEAMKLYGTTEVKGDKHNPVILEWAKDLGLDKVYKSDEIPWCGLFAAIVVKMAGFEPVKNPLWARNWAGFGTPTHIPMLGDVLVFTRESGGHVGFYVAEDNDCYHVLGGNQGDMVKVTRILKTRMLTVRRCNWKIKQPDAVRRINASASGEISKNES